MKLALRIALWVYGIYLAVLVIIVTPIVNFVTPQLVSDALGREFRLQSIVLNPFTLGAVMHKAELAEADGGEFASLQRAEVNLSLASIWKPGVALDELAVEGLSLRLQKNADGSLNIDDLTAGKATDDSEQSDAEIPAISIGKLLFTADHIAVADHSRDEPYDTHWQNLKLAVDDFSTIAEQGRPYSLQLSGPSGGELDWRGEVSIPASSSQGRLSLHNISLEPMARFAKPWIQFKLDQGRLDFATNYTVSWQQALSYQLTEGSIGLRELELKPLQPEREADTGITLQHLNISGISVDGDRAQVKVEEIAVDRLGMASRLLEDGVTLAQMLSPTDSDSAEDEQADPVEPADDAAQWQVSLQRIVLSDSQLDWFSPYTVPEQMTVSPINIEVADIDWPQATASSYTAQLSINQQAQLSADGQINIVSGNGTVNTELKALPIYWFGPNLKDALNTTLDSGEIAAKAQITLAEFAPQNINSSGAITEFSATVKEAEKSLTQFKSFAWQGLDIALDKRQLALQRLVLDQFSGRLHIHTDGSVNMQNAIAQRLEENAAEEPEQPVSEPESPWTISLQEFHLIDSELDFMDESLPLPFRTVIGQLNGTVSGLDSSAGSPAVVDIKGSVDGYAPVVLAGSSNPFADLPEMDLELTLDGVDLTGLTPYSGNYAGYAIDRGLINLDLQYSLAKNRLKGDNHVVIDQLKLGERVDSEDALKLPLGLAISLLTDANGVIDLAVPVKGDIDDPEFSLGSVIISAFVNLITKAVAAPFSLLGSLVSSDQDLQRVNFSAGSADLDAGIEQRLSLLAEALNKRPALTLVVNGSTDVQLDREQLQRAALEAALLTQGLSSEDITTQSPAWESAVTSRYQRLPDQSAGEEVPIALQYKALWQQQQIADATLAELARERAAAAKRFLVNEAGLSSDRAVIEWQSPQENPQGFNGVEMSLE